MTEKKKLAILGSSGSIGTQALDVIRANPDLFEVEILTVNSNADALIQQALEFNPNMVVIADETQYIKVKEALDPKGIKVFTGQDSIAQTMELDGASIVLNALVGYAGLKPTINAIKSGKTIALANKETLVVAGALINELAMEHKVSLIPVDSEHSAIFQCLVGEYLNPVEKIYLTASGGPFRGKDRKFLETVTREQALKHPNWSMGAKITIDSATLMNKGLEVIEARWLFDLKKEQIDVVVHPQSIIHSIVQFMDGSMKAQMGLPDMKLPIQYALGYPKRIPSDFPRLDFKSYAQLTFEQADLETFTCLQLAYDAMEKGGNMPCILNAANEVAVDAFLKDKISFLKIPDIIGETMAKAGFILKPAYEDYVETDKESRKLAGSLL